MPVIIVEVMPKAELLDPQGKAVAGALGRTGSRFSGVRIGKRFELSFDGESDAAALAEARELAEHLLSNSVIEDVVSVHVLEPAGRAESGDAVRRGFVVGEGGAETTGRGSGDAAGDGPVEGAGADGTVGDVRSVRGHFATTPGAAASSPGSDS